MAGQERNARRELSRAVWRSTCLIIVSAAPMGSYMGAMEKTIVTYKGPML